MEKPLFKAIEEQCFMIEYLVELLENKDKLTEAQELLVIRYLKIASQCLRAEQVKGG